MYSLNMNYSVKVKLNDKGKDIYYHRYDKYNRPELFTPRFPKVDKDGFSEFQLWHLMEIYGEYMKMGCETPFEDLCLYIEEDDLKDVSIKE